MAQIRPETEVDRTQAALVAHGATLPLAHGEVEIAIEPVAAASSVGQRLLVVLVNLLSRMKGVVARVHVLGADGQEILPVVPLLATELEAGLAELVGHLNSNESDYRAEIAFGRSADAVARVHIGSDRGDGIAVAADGWRALLGRDTEAAAWSAAPPYGAALAASLAATEVFKQLLAANGGPDPARRPVTDLAYSAFNYGVGTEAALGPDLRELVLGDLAVVGCGAGGSATLYVLAMQPGLAGEIALIERDSHKLSNLNRYLMTTSADVHQGRHKLATAVDHLARFAPRLHPTIYPQNWEELDSHPWPFLLSTVDTVDARWAIQHRALQGAEILDGAVLDLLYSLLRVVPGGRCLECKHPYDAELPLKQRAERWGQDVDTIRCWTADNVTVTAEMIDRLALTQNKPPEEYAELKGVPFCDVPRLTECGETALRTDVPSQAPVLPLATTPVGVFLAAEIAKRDVNPEAQLNNWLAHDLARPSGRILSGAARAPPVRVTRRGGMELTEDGLGETSAPAGYELLDSNSLTTSDFKQRVAYRRALEGELSKTIMAMDGIDNATVRLALPRTSYSSRTASRRPLRSSCTPAKPLSSLQVQAVVFLVTSAVEGPRSRQRHSRRRHRQGADGGETGARSRGRRGPRHRRRGSTSGHFPCCRLRGQQRLRL